MSATVVEGVGLNTGSRARVWLHRAEGPMRFRTGGCELIARPEAVVATRRCTVLGGPGTELAMVEHLLAALRVAGFWSGVVVEVEGPELPVLDGSAGPWREPVAALGAPPEAPAPLTFAAPAGFAHGATRFQLTPGAERLGVEVDYPHPAIGRQSWRGGPESFDALLDARTFATLEEYRALRAAGGLRGAEEGRGIVFGDEGPSAPLRWPDEPARHKALDAIGDLALLGRPLLGSLTIERGSHAAHVAFMLQLLAHHTPPNSGPSS